MEFINSLKNFAERVATLKPNLETEEATKNGLIMPFIQLLGYDVFNPMEVIPEYVADIGTKKGEKVDYAILQDNEPIMIIECKHWKENLDVHNSQLHRYFHASKARFGVLTNGAEYRFYTDLEEANKMDAEPFLTVDFENFKEHDVNEVKKFHKSNFDVDKIIDTASELKYSSAIKEILEKELNEPSEEFVKYFGRQIYNGKITAKVLEQLTGIVKKATNQSIKEIVNDRLHSALKKEEEAVVEEVVEEVDDNRIETTEEEIEGYHIVRSIVRTKIEPERIVHRDTQSYFGILIDDNNRKPICRLHLNGSKKYLGLFDDNKKEEKILIEKLDDIYNYEEKLIEAALRYMN
ncbi:type I restriction endonuclease [Carboxylicivirga sp. M1479]|uniref:type I restriction endonuclease n=1 Tax=Carboxylicivirga sp. M1479 TaxID=2594476 RepID=UPI0011774445|nr:type I restriction endonuclease [Carboxylicivirga sp. M1479]TRX71497.1 restriction endonuclease [Carboxylicivirga sp. M1479]